MMDAKDTDHVVDYINEGILQELREAYGQIIRMRSGLLMGQCPISKRLRAINLLSSLMSGCFDSR